MESQTRNKIIQIGIEYVEMFEKDNVFFIESVVKFAALRRLLLWVYTSLLADKKISPIERLDHANKLSLWSDAKEFAAGRLNNEDCISLSKILYTLKVL